MEEEDDDFYDPADAVPVSNTQNAPHNQSSNATPQHSNDDEEIEVEEDDDDEFNIITEAPPDAPAPEVPHPRHSMLRTESQRTPSTDLFPGSKSATPTLTPKAEPTTPVSGIARPTAPQKPGSEYPPVHASTIDVHANPTHPTTGKPILSTDMDFDFEDDKPWRRPGTDISDYFNYGFDEFTWASYVLKQRELRREVGDQKKQLDEMQAFLNGGMPPPMPGGPQPGPAPGPAAGPPPMPGMPGMPDMSPEIMQGILSTMMSRGLDPSTMDPMTFMQHAQAFMSGQSGAGGGQPAQAGFAGQGGQPQMGYGGGFNAGRGRGRRW